MKKFIAGLVVLIGCLNLGCQTPMDEEVSILRRGYIENSEITGLGIGESSSFYETRDRSLAQVFIFGKNGVIKRTITYSDKDSNGEYDTKRTLDIGELRLTPLPIPIPREPRSEMKSSII